MDPVVATSSDSKSRVEAGLALCLSGGGFRAMLFHAGAIWRLNEAGLLARLARISSVSGGSITAGLVGLRWSKLLPGDSITFRDEIVEPLREFASTTIDLGAVVGGVLLPGSIAERVIAAYEKHLFGDATLQDLPSEPDGPRFVINATNVQSGALWRFSKPYMADYRVGLIRRPQTPIAVAVAASSAFPPVLSPVDLELDPALWEQGSGTHLQHEPFTTRVMLTDGGVYDNLGLETAWKRYETILVSDAGGKIQPDGEPGRDWATHMKRVLDVIDDQVRSLRKRQLIEAYRQGVRKGTYWSIRTNIADYGLLDHLPAPLDRSMELASIPTRLARLEPELQDRLINWGFSVCDAALRRHVDATIPKAARLPYPGGV